MRHLKQFFSKEVDCFSPLVGDVERVVNVDEKGCEHIVYEPVDYHRLQEFLGTCDQWSLKALVDAGIDPRFGIHTGFNTGLDAHNAIMNGINAIEKSVESEKTE